MHHKTQKQQKKEKRGRDYDKKKLPFKININNQSQNITAIFVVIKKAKKKFRLEKDFLKFKKVFFLFFFKCRKKF
jgi:hypothetical protein